MADPLSFYGEETLALSLLALVYQSLTQKSRIFTNFLKKMGKVTDILPT